MVRSVIAPDVFYDTRLFGAPSEFLSVCARLF